MKIELYGDVVSDEYDWLYSLFEIPHCCPKNVRDAMTDLPADEDLILEVNSPGGDVWAGFEIYGLLQKLQGRTEAHIIALAASAATTITSACTKVLASPVAQFMIHQPAALAGYVNNEGARQLQNFLDSVKASIINGYVVKSSGKASRKTFEKLVDNETFMPIQDAIDLGLVDGYLDTDEETDALLSAGGGLKLSNALGSQSADALLERYEAAVKAGTMQEVPGHPVTRENAQAVQNEPQRSAEDEAVNAVLIVTTTAPDCGSLLHEDPAITEKREIRENLIENRRLQADLDLEKARFLE